MNLENWLAFKPPCPRYISRVCWPIRDFIMRLGQIQITLHWWCITLICLDI